MAPEVAESLAKHVKDKSEAVATGGPGCEPNDS